MPFNNSFWKMISFSEPGLIYLLCPLFVHSAAVTASLVIVFYHPLIYVIQFNCVSARHVDLCSLVCVGVSSVEMFFHKPLGFFHPSCCRFAVFLCLFFYTVGFITVHTY